MVRKPRKSKVPTKSGNEKVAFVIMPILSSKDDKNAHYRSIFEDYIKPVIEGNYRVVRADEIKRGGSITGQIVENLVSADLVVADLSEHNPNVLYELGIRHAVRTVGTIILINGDTSPSIPSDISNFRTIFYRDSAEGLATLRRELSSFVDVLEGDTEDFSDSPVSTFLKGIGHNSAVVGQILSGHRSSNITRESENARAFRESFDALERLEIAREEAEQGFLPRDLLEKAEDAARDEEISVFLDIFDTFRSARAFRPTDKEYSQMYTLANRMDSRNVADAILDIGLREYPNSKILAEIDITRYAHSTDAADWERAIEIGESYFGVNLRNSDVDVEALSAEMRTGMLGIILDAFHKLGRHDDALKITDALTKRMPNSSMALRNYARSMDGKGAGFTEVKEIYQSALKCKDVSDTTAHWYANFLSRHGDEIGALAADFMACMLDLDDSQHYARAALRLSQVFQPSNQFVFESREYDLPDEFSEDSVGELILLSRSCDSFGVDERFYCKTAMDNVGFDDSDIDRIDGKLGDLSRRQRGEIISRYHSLIIALGGNE